MEEYHQVKQEINQKKSNKGLIVTLVIVIILAIGGIIGTWYYMNNKAKSSKKSQDEQIQQLQNQIQELSQKVKEYESKNISLNEQTSIQNAITAQVKSIYDYWLNGSTPSSPVSYQSLKDRNYITQSYLDFQKSANLNYDPLTCSQNALAFKDYVFKTPTVKDTKNAEVSVEANYAESGIITIRLGMVNENGVWKINTITCPTQKAS
jgi:cell division protein FtsB